MKQYNTILCITLSALLLVSCSSNKTEIQENADTEITSVTTQAVTSVHETEKITRPVTKAVTTSKSGETSDPYYPVIPVSRDDLPVMCSMPSAIGLESRIKAKLFDSRSNMPPDVSYGFKYSYFSQLLSGKADLILSTPVSESEQQEADEAGVHLNSVPVAKEALVFFVSSDNPVSSLSQEQIRDIYSGKITNWAELGGNDEEIISYQRSDTSKSQYYMKEFMEGYDLIEPQKNSLVPASENSLFISIDEYTNEPNSIGYSSYSYAVQICENSDSIKLVTVDGITPSEETLADNTYPLLNSICIIHRDDPSEKTTRFIDWLLSESGQTCVLESGFVPLKKTEATETFKLYEARGTGKEMPENYTPSRKISVISGERIGDLSYINNEDLRNMIKEDLRACKPEMNSKDYEFSGDSFYGENGYITFCKIFSVVKDGHHLLEARYLTYDLTESKRLMNYSDLFFKDSDFVPLLNKSVAYIMSNSEFGSYIPENDFLGITEEMNNFSIASVLIPENSPYFEPYHYDVPPFSFRDRTGSYENYRTAYNLLPLEMVTGEYHDFNEYITTENHAKISITEKSRHEWYSHSILKETARNYYINYDIVNGSLFHTSEEIRQRNDIINKVITHVREKYETIHPIVADPTAAPMTAGNICKYNFHSDDIYNVMPDCTSESSEYYTETDYYLNLLAGFMDRNDHYNNLFYENSFFDHHYAGYDPETGEPLTFADVFGPEFSDIDESYKLFTYSVSSEPDSSDCVRFVYGDPFKTDGETEIVEIPIVRDDLNMKYFIPADETMVSRNSVTNTIRDY